MTSGTMSVTARMAMAGVITPVAAMTAMASMTAAG